MDNAMNDGEMKLFFNNNYVIVHLTVDESKDKKILKARTPMNCYKNITAKTREYLIGLYLTAAAISCRFAKA